MTFITASHAKPSSIAFHYCPTESLHTVVQISGGPNKIASQLMINLHEDLGSDTQKNEHVQRKMRRGHESHEASNHLFHGFPVFLFSLFSFIAAGKRYQLTHHWLSHGTVVCGIPSKELIEGGKDYRDFKSVQTVFP